MFLRNTRKSNLKQHKSGRYAINLVEKAAKTNISNSPLNLLIPFFTSYIKIDIHYTTQTTRLTNFKQLMLTVQ